MTSTSERGAPVPWIPRDLMRLAWTTGIGAAGILIAYLEISATVVLSRQLGWLAVSIGMLVVAGLGNAFFLTEGARRTRARARRLSTEPMMGTRAGHGPGALRPATWIELLEETRRSHRRRPSR